MAHFFNYLNAAVMKPVKYRSSFLYTLKVHLVNNVIVTTDIDLAFEKSKNCKRSVLYFVMFASRISPTSCLQRKKFGIEQYLKKSCSTNIRFSGCKSVNIIKNELITLKLKEQNSYVRSRKKHF